MNLNVFEYLLEKKILNKQEFQDLISLREIKINDNPISDPAIKVTEGTVIKIGFKEYIV